MIFIVLSFTLLPFSSFHFSLFPRYVMRPPPPPQFHGVCLLRPACVFVFFVSQFVPIILLLRRERVAADQPNDVRQPINDSVHQPTQRPNEQNSAGTTALVYCMFTRRVLGSTVFLPETLADSARRWYILALTALTGITCSALRIPYVRHVYQKFDATGCNLLHLWNSCGSEIARVHGQHVHVR